MSDQKPSFADWLRIKLRERGWSESELARRAGVSRSAINLITNEKTSPGYEVASGIADALGLRREDVFRIAGLLPSLPENSDKAVLEEAVEIIRQLPVNEQKDVLDYARMRLRRASQNSNEDNILVRFIKDEQHTDYSEVARKLKLSQEELIALLETAAEKLRLSKKNAER